MSSIFNNNLENIVYLRRKSVFATKTKRHEKWSIENIQIFLYVLRDLCVRTTFYEACIFNLNRNSGRIPPFVANETNTCRNIQSMLHVHYMNQLSQLYEWVIK